MQTELLSALAMCETDVDGALRRFSGDERLYLSLLTEFKNETTIDRLNDDLSVKDWNDAFMAAHALKGLAGNMGFVPLFHAVGELIVLIRTGRTEEIIPVQRLINNYYSEVIYAIDQGIEDKKE